MKRFESIHSYKTTCICKFHFSLHAILQTRVDVVKSSMMMMRSEWRAKFPAHVLAASCNLNESEQVLNKKILIIMALSFLSVKCKSIAKSIAPYQILALRNLRYTGTAKLLSQTFATCKRITPQKFHLKWELRREKSCTNLVPHHATIEKDLNVVNQGPPNCEALPSGPRIHSIWPQRHCVKNEKIYIYETIVDLVECNKSQNNHIADDVWPWHCCGVA